MRVLFPKGFFSVSKLVFSRGVREFPLRIQLFGGVSRTFCYHVASQASSIASICWNSMVRKPRWVNRGFRVLPAVHRHASTQSRWENALKVGGEKKFQFSIPSHTNANSAWTKFTAQSRTVHLQGHDQQKTEPPSLQSWTLGTRLVDHRLIRMIWKLLPISRFVGGLGRKNAPAPREKSKT